MTDKVVLSDKDFRAFYLNSSIERMIVAVEEGRFVYSEVNSAAAAYFGLPRERMLGRTPAGLFEPVFAAHIENAYADCVRARAPTTYNALPRFGGGVRMHVFLLNPLFDSDGNLRFIDVMTRPAVTDAAQLKRERDDALMLMTSIFDASGIGIIITDRNARVVRVNDAFESDFGWTRDDLLGEFFTAMLPEGDRELSMRLHASFIATGRHGSRELRMLGRDGRTAYVAVTSALMELSQGRRFMVTTVRDMTERRVMMHNLQRAKEEADGASRAKSSFLANMSHELRTPLNAIIGFTELMRDQTFGPVGHDKYREYLGDIHFSACHLLEIINDVLDMSKIEAGKVELTEGEIVLAELFDSVLRIMADRAQAGTVPLDFHADPGLPHIKGDLRMLRQVLINLVSNSIKFSPPGSPVVVRATAGPGGGVRLMVVDKGCGIAEAKIKLVMQPFGQATDSRYSAGQGTGLGLPLARAMTELHGGTLSLESAEGQGTRVRIDLPSERTLPPG